MVPMVKTVHIHVATNVMVVTTFTVTVIDVNLAGWETTVNMVMLLDSTMF